MANRLGPPGFVSTTHDNFRHPFLNQYDYKYYEPQLFTESRYKYWPNKGTVDFFQNYRRSQVPERRLQENLKTMTTPQCSSLTSDKPDVALGRRKYNRELLFPVIHNNPVYQLTNRIPDRERDRDKFHMKESYSHRDQYKDLTGSLHVKSSYFYHPQDAHDTFQQKVPPKNFIWDFPGRHTAANEFTYKLERAKPMHKYMESSVS